MRLKGSRSPQFLGGGCGGGSRFLGRLGALLGPPEASVGTPETPLPDTAFLVVCSEVSRAPPVRHLRLQTPAVPSPPSARDMHARCYPFLSAARCADILAAQMLLAARLLAMSRSGAATTPINPPT